MTHRATACAEDYIFRNGVANGGNINNCNAFLRRLLVIHLQIPLAYRAWDFFDRQGRWSQVYDAPGRTEPILDLRYVTAGATADQNVEKKFNLRAVCSSKMAKRDATCLPANIPPMDNKPPTPVDNAAQSNEMAADPIASDLSPMGLALDDDFVDHAPSPDVIGTGAGGIHSTIARIGGTWKVSTSVTKDVLPTLGIAGGAVLGAAFVVVDSVDGDWKGGAICAVADVASLAAGFAVSGPVGWIIDIAIGAFFASKSSFS